MVDVLLLQDQILDLFLLLPFKFLKFLFILLLVNPVVLLQDQLVLGRLQFKIEQLCSELLNLEQLTDLVCLRVLA